jgi:hypothetical protein
MHNISRWAFVQKRPYRQGCRNRGASWTPGVSGGGSHAASSVMYSSFKVMKEITTLVFVKGAEATLETVLQERGAKLDATGARWRPPCCVFLHPLVLQINGRRYNVSIGQRHRSNFRDGATGTGGQVGPQGCQVEAPVLRLPSSLRPSN